VGASQREVEVGGIVDERVERPPGGDQVCGGGDAVGVGEVAADDLEPARRRSGELIERRACALRVADDGEHGVPSPGEFGGGAKADAGSGAGHRDREW
jgi:hypothetical protein